jgi:hypothetical protein
LSVIYSGDNSIDFCSPNNKVGDLGSIDLTLHRIVNAMKEKKPLIFLYCFGGYKNHNCLTYPEVDWAEFFQLKFFIEYLLPIIKNYRYGVIIQYESEDIIIEKNYVPRNSLDRYAASFKKLLLKVKMMIKSQFNIDLNIELVRCREQYDNQKLYELMHEQEDRLLQAFNALSDEMRIKWLQRAETNIMWENVENSSKLTSNERAEIIKNARIQNECFLAADYLLRGYQWDEYGGVDFFDRCNCIPFVGTWGYMPSDSPTDLWFHLKSSATSSVDFWIGTGIVSRASIDDKILVERIISPQQYRKIENKLTEISVSDNPLMDVSNNFNKLKIYTGKFPF